MHYTSPQHHIDGQNPTANPPETEPAVKPPLTMPFGKHKGRLMSDVPDSYLAWFLAQPNLKNSLRRFLTKEVDRRRSGKAPEESAAITVNDIPMDECNWCNEPMPAAEARECVSCEGLFHGDCMEDQLCYGCVIKLFEDDDD